MFKRGSIYLAKLYPSKGHEVGKTRPVLVIQTDMLNEVEHTTVTILPLTSQCIEESYPLRYNIEKREGLTKDSDILCDQIRTIDINRLDAKAVAYLTQTELYEIQEQIKILLELE